MMGCHLNLHPFDRLVNVSSIILVSFLLTTATDSWIVADQFKLLVGAIEFVDQPSTAFTELHPRNHEQDIIGVDIIIPDGSPFHSYSHWCPAQTPGVGPPFDLESACSSSW